MDNNAKEILDIISQKLYEEQKAYKSMDTKRNRERTLENKDLKK